MRTAYIIKNVVSEKHTLQIGGVTVYPNLLGQKAYHHLTDDDMGKIIGVSRQSYAQKIRSGRFTPRECMLLINYFKKPFEFLFEDGATPTPPEKRA